MKLRSLVLGILLLVALLGTPGTKAKCDDCQVAFEIAYEQAYEFCMATIGEEGTCKYQACNEANRHAVDIGCPPQSCP